MLTSSHSNPKLRKCIELKLKYIFNMDFFMQAKSANFKCWRHHMKFISSIKISEHNSPLLLYSDNFSNINSTFLKSNWDIHISMV